MEISSLLARLMFKRISVVSHYATEEIKEGRRILDIRYKIFPHKNFVAETIKSNKRANQTRSQLDKELIEGDLNEDDLSV